MRGYIAGLGKDGERTAYVFRCLRMRAPPMDWPLHFLALEAGLERAEDRVGLRGGLGKVGSEGEERKPSVPVDFLKLG